MASLIQAAWADFESPFKDWSPKKRYIIGNNACLAGIHFTTTFAIWAYGIHTLQDRSKTNLSVDISPWYSLNNTGGCTEDDYVKDSLGPKVGLKTYSVDLLTVCILFTVVSGLYHVIIVWYTIKTDKLILESWFNMLRWIDYGLSTPLMGIVLYASYGIDDFNGVLTQGAAFLGLQCVGAAIELGNSLFVIMAKTSGRKETFLTMGYIQRALYVLSFGGFAILSVIFTPLFRNMVLLQKVDKEGSDERVNTSPPPAVVAFTAILLWFYVLFGAVSLLSMYLARITALAYTNSQLTELLGPNQQFFVGRVLRIPLSIDAPSFEERCQYLIDKLYGACSATAKTILHWALALVILGQDEMVTDTRFDNPHIRCAASTAQVSSTQTVLAVVTCLGFLLGGLIIAVPLPSNTPKSGSTASNQAAQRLIDANYM